LGEKGAWAYPGTAQIFGAPPIISGTGKATNFKFGRGIQTLPVNGACPSLVICAMPTPVKTTPELSAAVSGPLFGVLPKTGDEELEDRGKPG